jgi:hypothetical protein
MKIRDMIKSLRELEIIRVDNDEAHEATKASAHKAFKPLSGAVFQSN